MASHAQGFLLLCMCVALLGVAVPVEAAAKKRGSYTVLDAKLKASLLKPLNRVPLPATALSQAQLNLGTFLSGDRTRLRKLLQKLLEGSPVKIAYLGGGAAYDAAVFSKFKAWVVKSFPNPQHRFYFWSPTGATAGFGRECLSLAALPSTLDLAWVAYFTNEPYFTGATDYQHRAFEGVIRRLLQLPGHPAVVPVDFYNPAQPFYSNVGGGDGAIAEYYRLPQVSLRNAAYLASARKVKALTGLFSNSANPNSLNAKGASVAASLMVNLLRVVGSELILRMPYSGTENKYLSALPPVLNPRFQGDKNKLWIDAGDSFCIFNTAFKASASQVRNFTYVSNTAAGWVPGWAASTPGASLVLTIDAFTHIRDQGNKLIPQDMALAVHSGPDMGKFTVECLPPCTCSNATINGGSSTSAVVAGIVPQVSQYYACQIKVTVLDESSTVGHNVKITGAVMSIDETGYTDYLYGFKLVDPWKPPVAMA